MVTFSIDITKTDLPADAGVTFYPAPNEKRILPSKDYNFSSSYILIFGPDGLLWEAGSELIPNTDFRLGSAQLSICIPAGGFALAFGKEAPQELMDCYGYAMEDVMLYNSTMSIIRTVQGKYENKTLQISYEENIQTDPDALKFLFIGNSCTYFHGVPLKFRALCASAGYPVEVTYCTYGAAFLYQYADEEHKYHEKFKKCLKEAHYDYASLQCAGSATYEQVEDALSILLPKLQENGARPLLYMRCAPTNDPQKFPLETKRISEIYRSLGQHFSIPVAPAAEAFAIATKERPDINLYADDCSHHSAYGSYLVACCLAKSFLDIDVRGLSYDAHLGKDVVTYLQELAYGVCK